MTSTNLFPLTLRFVQRACWLLAACALASACGGVEGDEADDKVGAYEAAAIAKPADRFASTSQHPDGHPGATELPATCCFDGPNGVKCYIYGGTCEEGSSQCATDGGWAGGC